MITITKASLAEKKTFHQCDSMDAILGQRQAINCGKKIALPKCQQY